MTLKLQTACCDCEKRYPWGRGPPVFTSLTTSWQLCVM